MKLHIYNLIRDRLLIDFLKTGRVRVLYRLLSFFWCWGTFNVQPV